MVRRLIRAPTLESSPKLSLLAIREEEAGAATLRPLPHIPCKEASSTPRRGLAQVLLRIKIEDKDTS